MKSIEMNVGKLVNILTNNKDNHVLKYNEAFAKFLEKKKKLINTYNEKINYGENVDIQELIYLENDRPRNYLKDYDQAINMLLYHEQPTIEIELSDYRKFVDDNWDWKDRFETNYSNYTNG